MAEWPIIKLILVKEAISNEAISKEAAAEKIIVWQPTVIGQP